MRYVSKDFENEYKDGANFVSEFVRKMFHEKLGQFEIEELCFFPKDLEETARLNMWKRVRWDLMESLEHVKLTHFDYSFVVFTIMEEVKRIINDTNMPRSEKMDEVFSWIVFYSMTLFVKDERLKFLGEEYDAQMYAFKVNEAAKLLQMDYLVPMVELSVSVCVWAEIQLPIEKKKEALPEPPKELNTDYAKKMFSKAVEAGLMKPLKNGKGYQWNKSNALLAFFCGKIYCGDRLTKNPITKELEIETGRTEYFPETALMSFFVNKEMKAIKNLGQSRLQLRAKRAKEDYVNIDALFEEAT